MLIKTIAPYTIVVMKMVFFCIILIISMIVAKLFSPFDSSETEEFPTINILVFALTSYYLMRIIFRIKITKPYVIILIKIICFCIVFLIFTAIISIFVAIFTHSTEFDLSYDLPTVHIAICMGMLSYLLYLIFRIDIIIKMVAMLLVLYTISMIANFEPSEYYEKSSDDLVGVFYVGLSIERGVDLEMKMAGHILRIPIDRLRSFVSPDRDDITQTAGFSMIGLWPGFRSKSTSSNVNRDFRWFRNPMPPVTVSVEPSCRPGVSPEVNCTAAWRMKSPYDYHVKENRNFVPTHIYPGITAPEIEGMKHIGFIDSFSFARNDHPYLATKVGINGKFDENVYVNIDEQGQLELVTCVRRLGGACYYHFVWRNAFQLEVGFPASYIPDFHSIQTKIVEILEDALVESSAQPPRKGRRVFPFPMNKREFSVYAAHVDAISGSSKGTMN